MTTYPVRAGVFSSADSAFQLIHDLRERGFGWDEISIICSDEKTAELFPVRSRRTPSRMLERSAMGIAATGALGLGGAAVTAALIAGPGVAVLVIGAFAGVAAAGTFTTLMATRGFETEAADFYEQAVQDGMILVVVEVPDSLPNAEERRHQAEVLISQAGSQPLSLSH
jgi:hypothetical protein